MLRVGNAPLSWGVFEGDAATNPPWSLVLDQIVEAGYRDVELGPVGFLPEDTDVLRKELSVRGLSLTAGFVYENLHDPSLRSHVLRTVHRVSRVLGELGASRLVIIDRMLPERQRTAGRTVSARRLRDPEWSQMMDVIGWVAQIASGEYGLRPVLHPHCGAFIEFEDEIDRALVDLSSDAVGLCIDTGHAAVAGMQAKDLVRKYPDRVEYFHLKDVEPRSLERMRNSTKTFDEGLADGLFCPLGQGMVDFVGLRDSLLEQTRFDGVATVEQDPDPSALEHHSGLATAKESLAYLRSIGIAADRGVDTKPDNGRGGQVG